MTIECSVFIATSLDGFIAREDGGIDWLNAASAGLPEGEDCGYKLFISDIDTLVMGRNTFEQVLTFGAWSYGAMPVVVMSRGEASLASDVASTVTASRETPGELVARLETEGCKHLYVDGGLLVQSFLAAGLIDDLTITVIPVLLGTGRSLFGALPADVQVVHESTHVYEFGFVQHKYSVRRET
jgi:dihydrofolate reductase